MKFKADTNTSKIQRGQSQSATPAKSTTNRSNAASAGKGSGGFSVNTGSFTGTLADIVPGEMQGWFGEIGAALGGIDLNQPLSWSKEQVIEAKRIATDLDKKVLELAEVKAAILKYLAYACKEAEFKADVSVAMAKAKGYIDKQAARAYLAYASYLRKAARLEKRVKATQEIIDGSNQALESAMDERKGKLLAAINTQAKLGSATEDQLIEMRTKRKETLEAHKQQMNAYKQELATGHLSGASTRAS